MSNFDLRGVIPPVITPLDDKENIDEKALRDIINHCIGSGLHGIFVAGSAGETMSLTREQRKRAIEIALDEAGGRVPVLCGVMDTGTRRVVENIKELEQSGLEYAVVTPPFYIKNSCQGEILRHFEKVAESTRAKLVIYNIPANTQVNILPGTVKELSGLEQIIGLKDSSGNWPQFQEYLFLLKNTGFKLFQGLPEFAAVSLLLGADGLTPVYSILLPRIYLNLYKNAVQRNIDKTFELQKIVSEINHINRLASSHISIQKFGISLLELSSKRATLPCEPLRQQEEEAVRDFLDHYIKIDASVE